MDKHKTLSHLHVNARFYILAFTVVSSLVTASWLRVSTASDTLYFIRLQQLSGFAALVWWYGALVISPFKKVFGERKYTPLLVFSRRAIGVSAAYFALLHTFIAVFKQLGGFSGIPLLPSVFARSLLLGTIALALLALMAVTSFDKVIKLMRFPRWKLLHRLGYFAGVCALLHVWMIGTHMTYFGFKIAFLVMLLFLLSLESIRAAREVSKRFRLKRLETNFIALLLILGGFLLLIAVPRLIGNYHEEHPNSQMQAEGSH